MTIPRNEIEPIIQQALALAKSSNRIKFVRSINWEDLYSDIGITDDSEMEIGTLHAVCSPDGTVKRTWLTRAEAIQKGE